MFLLLALLLLLVVFLLLLALLLQFAQLGTLLAQCLHLDRALGDVIVIQHLARHQIVLDLHQAHRDARPNLVQSQRRLVVGQIAALQVLRQNDVRILVIKLRFRQ
uniref:Putative secreted peptide n=1 Tax=Anopheles braziliensis TaxID=58242 RepID=A0A2M3ZT84_9DIPT